MQIFLIGHGAWNPNARDTPAWFNVPARVTVQCYVKHLHKFDSNWERDIRAGKKPQHHDFHPQRFGPGSRCINYWLTVPGGIRSEADVVDPIDPQTGAMAVADGHTYALPNGANPWYVSLERICATCANPLDDRVIHWFACRDEVGYKGVDVAGLQAEAGKGFLGKLPLESAGWNAAVIPQGNIAAMKARLGKH